MCISALFTSSSESSRRPGGLWKERPPKCMARKFLGAPDGGQSVLGLCNCVICHQLSLGILCGRAQVSGGMRLCTWFSYFPPERSGEVWEEANASASLVSQLSFLRVSAFQKQKFTEAELLVFIHTVQPVSHRNPVGISLPSQALGASLHALSSMMLWTQLLLECGSVAFTLWECCLLTSEVAARAGSSWQPGNSRCVSGVPYPNYTLPQLCVYSWGMWCAGPEAQGFAVLKIKSGDSHCCQRWVGDAKG